jgi:hypothetical protein
MKSVPVHPSTSPRLEFFDCPLAPWINVVVPGTALAFFPSSKAIDELPIQKPKIFAAFANGRYRITHQSAKQEAAPWNKNQNALS